MLIVEISAETSYNNLDAEWLVPRYWVIRFLRSGLRVFPRCSSCTVLHSTREFTIPSQRLYTQFHTDAYPTKRNISPRFNKSSFPNLYNVLSSISSQPSLHSDFQARIIVSECEYSPACKQQSVIQLDWTTLQPSQKRICFDDGWISDNVQCYMMSFVQSVSIPNILRLFNALRARFPNLLLVLSSLKQRVLTSHLKTYHYQNR